MSNEEVPPLAPSPEDSETTPPGLDQFERVPPHNSATTSSFSTPKKPPQQTTNDPSSTPAKTPRANPITPRKLGTPAEPISSSLIHSINDDEVGARYSSSNSIPLISPTSLASSRQDWRRFLALFIFSLVSTSASFGSTLVPLSSSSLAMQLYGISSVFLSILLILLPSAFLFISPYSAYVATLERGVRGSIIISAILTLLASILRAIFCIEPFYSSNSMNPATKLSHTCLIIAQLLSGGSSSFVLSTPSALSSVWFKANQRTTATCIALSAHLLGLVLSISMGREIQTIQSLKILLFIDTGFSLLGLIFSIFIPSLPKHPPSITGAKLRMAVRRASARSTWILQGTPLRYLRAVHLAFSNKTSIAILISSGLAIGSSVSWHISLPRVLLETGSAVSADRASWLGLTGICSAFISTIIIPTFLIDFFHQRQHKQLSLMSLIGQSLLVILLLGISAVPSKNLPEWVLSSTFLTIIVVICGICAGSYPAILLELGAESLYPVPAGVSSALITTFGSVIVLLVSIISSKIPFDPTGNGAFSVVITGIVGGTSVFASLILSFTRIHLVRLDLDEGLDLVDNPVAP